MDFFKNLYALFQNFENAVKVGEFRNGLSNAGMARTPLSRPTSSGPRSLSSVAGLT